MDDGGVYRRVRGCQRFLNCALGAEATINEMNTQLRLCMNGAKESALNTNDWHQNLWFDSALVLASKLYLCVAHKVADAIDGIKGLASRRDRAGPGRVHVLGSDGHVHEAGRQLAAAWL